MAGRLQQGGGQCRQQAEGRQGVELGQADSRKCRKAGSIQVHSLKRLPPLRPVLSHPAKPTRPPTAPHRTYTNSPPQIAHPSPVWVVHHDVKHVANAQAAHSLIHIVAQAGLPLLQRRGTAGLQGGAGGR